MIHEPPDRPDPSLRPTAVRVVAIEILCVLVLWWIGRVFGA